ncbi:MAG: glycine zipper family protein [Mariprofundaceae bacterium]|nr:glycine zipper family protein [Mariprofundaceae bacterium]
MNKLLMFMLVLGLSSCATYEQQRAATTGAVVGGVAGAVIGADSGRAVEGAAIGAAVGAAAGAVITTPRNKRYNRQHRGYGKNAVIVAPRRNRGDDDEHEREDEHDD